jgi:hypothetical protein
LVNFFFFPFFHSDNNNNNFLKFPEISALSKTWPIHKNDPLNGYTKVATKFLEFLALLWVANFEKKLAFTKNNLSIAGMVKGN